MDTEKVVEEHSRLIYKIASFYKEQAPLEDLYQVGIIGLLKALNNYNENENTKFSTYAVFYIKGEMLSYIKKNNPIKVNKDYFKLRKSYESAKEIMSQKLNRIPTKTEICLFLEVDESIIDDMLISINSVLSLDYENDDNSIYDTLGVDSTLEVDDMILVQNLLDSLDPIERKIIEYRYFKDYTQDATAKALGLSQIQVCRTEKKSILKLQKNAA